MTGADFKQELDPNSHHFGTESTGSAYTTFVVPKGSPLMNVLWKPMRTLQESGILTKIKWDSAERKPRLPREKFRRDRPLVITQVAPIFMFLAIGLTISTLALIAEQRGTPRPNILEG